MKRIACAVWMALPFVSLADMAVEPYPASFGTVARGAVYGGEAVLLALLLLLWPRRLPKRQSRVLAVISVVASAIALGTLLSDSDAFIVSDFLLVPGLLGFALGHVESIGSANRRAGILLVVDYVIVALLLAVAFFGRLCA